MITSENIKEAVNLVNLLNLPDITGIVPYIVGLAFIMILVYIINQISANRKAPKEYIENGVTLYFPKSENGVDHNWYVKLLRSIYEKSFLLYKNRAYTSCEVIITTNSSGFFIRIPKDVADQIESELKSGNIRYEDIHDPLDKLLKKYKNKCSSFMGELEKDIIFPLHIDSSSPSIKSVLGTGDCLYLQVLIRPVYQNWIKMVKDYQSSIEKGKDPTLNSYGCIGSFASITIPFLTFMLAFFSFLFNPSKEKEKIVQQNEGEQDLTKEQKLKAVEEKISDIGFEFSLRGIIYTSEDNKQSLYSKLIEYFESSQKDYYNNIIINIDSHRVSSSEEADFLLRYMDKSVVDILNDNELARLIESLYN